MTSIGFNAVSKIFANGAGGSFCGIGRAQQTTKLSYLFGTIKGDQEVAHRDQDKENQGIFRENECANTIR